MTKLQLFTNTWDMTLIESFKYFRSFTCFFFFLPSPTVIFSILQLVFRLAVDWSEALSDVLQHQLHSVAKTVSAWNRCLFIGPGQVADNSSTVEYTQPNVYYKQVLQSLYLLIPDHDISFFFLFFESDQIYFQSAILVIRPLLHQTSFTNLNDKPTIRGRCV